MRRARMSTGILNAHAHAKDKRSSQQKAIYFSAQMRWLCWSHIECLACDCVRTVLCHLADKQYFFGWNILSSLRRGAGDGSFCGVPHAQSYTHTYTHAATSFTTTGWEKNVYFCGIAITISQFVRIQHFVLIPYCVSVCVRDFHIQSTLIISFFFCHPPY